MRIQILRSAFLAVMAVPTHSAQPSEVVTQVTEAKLPNASGKKLLAVTVDFPPAFASQAHRHPSSAFVFAYVLEGTIESAVNNDDVRTYRVGQSWIEMPGDVHRVSANASKTRSAKLLAVFITDAVNEPVVSPDH